MCTHFGVKLLIVKRPLLQLLLLLLLLPLLLLVLLLLLLLLLLVLELLLLLQLLAVLETLRQYQLPVKPQPCQRRKSPEHARHENREIRHRNGFRRELCNIHPKD